MWVVVPLANFSCHLRAKWVAFSAEFFKGDVWCDIKEVWSLNLDGESSVTMGGVNADGGDDWTADVETDLDSELIGGSNGAEVDWCLCSTIGVGSTMFRQIESAVDALMVFSLSSPSLSSWIESLN